MSFWPQELLPEVRHQQYKIPSLYTHQGLQEGASAGPESEAGVAQ